MAIVVAVYVAFQGMSVCRVAGLLIRPSDRRGDSARLGGNGKGTSPRYGSAAPRPRGPAAQRHSGSARLPGSKILSRRMLLSIGVAYCDCCHLRYGPHKSQGPRLSQTLTI